MSKNGLYNASFLEYENLILNIRKTFSNAILMVKNDRNQKDGVQNIFP